MKRVHTLVSRSEAADTPLPVLGKKCRQHGLVGTPVEGLTGMPVDAPTPDSEGLHRPQIPDTTQRRLEGFCLNTPLTLSQAAAAETPTFGKDLQQNKQQQDGHQQQHAAGACVAEAAAAPPQQGHRLANISNLPPSPMHPACKSPFREEFAFDSDRGVADCSMHWTGPKQQQPGARQRRRQPQVTFLSSLLSPPASLPSSSMLGAAAAFTPYPPSAAWDMECPGSVGGFGEDDFVLHTSQSYIRASQPAISPNVAAGLAAAEPEVQEEDELQADEEEEEQLGAQPFTTPSQNSKEPPRQSPSNITCSNATHSVDQAEPEPTAGLEPLQQQQQHFAQRQFRQQWTRMASAYSASDVPQWSPAAAAGPGPGPGPSRFGSNSSSQSAVRLAGLPRCGSLGGLASVTPGDGLALLLGEDELLEETTTPELEQVGIGGSQEPGGSQLSAGLAGLGGGSRRAAAAAAAAGGGAAAGAGGSRGSVVLEEVTTKQVLFPIFRPKSYRKCVILVRHGESTYNKLDAHGKQWSDPTVFDAPLTAKGRLQAQGAHAEVARQLERHGHLGQCLWLSSPLSRAIETMLLAFPDVEALAQGRPGSARGPSSGAVLAATPADHRVVVLSMISEHCATTGDVGRPASQLAARFPGLSAQLGELPEQWWFSGACTQQPNCAEKRLFGKRESVEEMRRRVSEFSRWLRNRPEQLVVAFGHSTFWKYFANSKTKMRNCEVLQLWW
ncbi:hypothetical protein OEZ85_012593 [Tetradesmus obliquus]|uniref:Phosphoglycerate mutase (2,3-diphosphoglycerate-dependent) n=1 Tax=Tetradesmus obliquus TaxID=3088 RepID=A0ABY8U301_TETOB|nr:hypothetical protein OEZ85_012593 [Tetradesmus obliquus]